MLSIIVNLSKNNAIGCENKLLWHISDDLKRFKKITSGSTMIMGRKTFESLPGVLPNRRHVVITNDESFHVKHENVSISHDLIGTLEYYKNRNEEAFVIGGGSIYETSLPYCDKLYLTIVNKDVEADTYLRGIDYSQFKLTYSSEDLVDEKSGLSYKYLDYERSK